MIAARWAIAVGASILTIFFAWRAGHLDFATRPADLRPLHHPFLATHARHAPALEGGGDVTLLVEVDDGELFTPERLAQVYAITQALDSVRGIRHDRIESIAHRTTRVLDATAGGALRSGALMPRAPRTDAEAAAIRRSALRAEHLYGATLSRDHKATLVRAMLRPGVSDYARVLDDVERRVIAPAHEGWVGALMTERGGRVVVEHVFPASPAAEAGLRADDVVTTVNGEAATHPLEIAEAVADSAGAGVEIGFDRGGKSDTLTLVGGASGLRVSMAGDVSLYGSIERSAPRTYVILAAAALCAWAVLFLYFHDWRGALHPTLTAAAAALWGLGALELVGLGLDALAIVAPFFLTARALARAVQVHERYCEEASRAGTAKRDAIGAAYAASFRPAVAATLTDAVCVLALTLVPIAFVQKLAATAALWVVAIAAAELVLAPVVLDFLRSPDPDTLERRADGELQRLAAGVTHAVLTPAGRAVTLMLWVAVALACANGWPALTAAGGRDAALLRAGSAHETARARIEQKLGAAGAFIVMAEGRDKNALKEPHLLRAIEELQRELERDPAVASSVSLVDVLRSANGALHENDPRSAVLPHDRNEVGALFFATFAASVPGETQHVVSADYRTAPVTFFVRDGSPAALRRLAARAEAFIEKNPIDAAAFRLAAGPLGVAAAAATEAGRSVVIANVLGFAAVFVVLLFVHRSFTASFVATAPLVLANFAAAAAAGWRGSDLGVPAVCVLLLGLGLGAQLAVRLIARIVERYAALDGRYTPEHESDRLVAAVAEAVTAVGKPIAVGAAMIVATSLLWAASDVRFVADVALSLALWTAVTAAAVLTLIPAAIAVAEPAFVPRAARGLATRSLAAGASCSRDAGVTLADGVAGRTAPFGARGVDGATPGFARS